jgi:hypothetical protein
MMSTWAGFHWDWWCQQCIRIQHCQWNSLTHTWSGLSGGWLDTYAIAVSGSDVYVGGLFNGVPVYPSVPGTSNIAKWNSTTGLWSALGEEWLATCMRSR